jgi:foldase protein PrsA
MKTRFLLATAAAAVVVAGCGGGIPGDSVATVDGKSITKASYNHWLSIAAKSGGQTGASIPKPPDFKECIAQKRKSLPKPAKGQPTTTDAQLKTQCKSEYDALRDQVLQLLISFQWIEGEAKKQDVKVTDAEVKKQFETQRKASFPKDADYQKFLKQSGQSEADILQRVKLDLLSNKIREKITKGLDNVSDAEITKYYNENKSRFAQPERRDLLVVLTKTKAKADEAKAAIEGGQAFGAVAKEFSIDPSSKAQGGKLPAVAEGQQEQAFDKAIFSAKKGVLTGPVKTQFGYYVFKVTKVTPATQQSQQQASATIKQLLASQKQQKALDTFVKSFTKRWKDKTECRKGYQTTDCKNGPKPTPTPSTAPGTAVTVSPTQ